VSLQMEPLVTAHTTYC